MTNKHEIDTARKETMPALGIPVRVGAGQTADVNWLTRESLKQWLQVEEAGDPGFSLEMVVAMLGHPVSPSGDTKSAYQGLMDAMQEQADAGPETVFMGLIYGMLRHALGIMRLLGQEEYSHDALMMTVGIIARGAKEAPWLEENFEEASKEVIDAVTAIQKELLEQEGVPS